MRRCPTAEGQFILQPSDFSLATEARLPAKPPTTLLPGSRSLTDADEDLDAAAVSDAFWPLCLADRGLPLLG